MKKKLVLLLSVVLVVCSLLCACGGTNNTGEDSNNNTEYVEVDGERYGIGEIPKEIRENELKLKKYQSSEITIVGEITSVSYGAILSHVVIGSWDIEFDTDTYEDYLAELNAGDIVCITGNIIALRARLAVSGTSIQLQ